MKGIIDKLCMIQDDLEKMSNCSDTAMVDLVYHTDNTNTVANHDPDCTTQDDLDLNKVIFADDILSDFNLEKWGYIVTEDNFVAFIGCDRIFPDIKCIQDYLKIAHMVKDTGFPIPSGLQIDARGCHLQGYHCVII